MEPDYEEIARAARLKVLDLIHAVGTSHIGSNFSVIDLMAVLFEHVDLDKDKVILSKGWAAASLYYFLWKKGRITEEELNSYCQPGSKWINLAEPIHPDIPAAGGSMGYGLPMGVGFALAKKMKGEEGTIYVIMSDGELDIGTTWESALIAAHHKLDNLVVIVDYNGFQAMGKTDDILQVLLFSAFPFWYKAICDNGHHHTILEEMIFHPSRHNGQPFVLIANTIKGKGVSFMENNNDFHYLHVSDEDYKKAGKELMYGKW